MKKLLSLALAAIMALSLTIVAFADEEATLTDVSSITVTKTVEGNGLQSETYKFCVEEESVADAAEGITKENMPAIDDFEIKVTGGNSSTATITLPTYTSVGVYTYSIYEQSAATAGVDYDLTTFYLVVTVTYGEGGSLVRSVSVHQDDEDGDKVDSITFTNTYESGTLSVTKKVTGNMGDTTQEFSVTVTFSSNYTVNSWIQYEIDDEEDIIDTEDWEKNDGIYSASLTFTLKDGETVEFGNIPAGVTYTVTESDYSSDGYTTSYTYSDKSKIISANDSDTVVITNDKSTTVDTGINLDTLPYVMMLAVVAVAAIALMMKKRSID